MKFPKELEELMWEIAESEDEDLVAGFRARYPDDLHQAALAERIKAVRELKKAKIEVVEEAPTVPEEPFVPTPGVTEPKLWPQYAMVSMLTVLILGALIFATYSVIRYNDAVTDRRSGDTIVIQNNPPVAPQDGTGVQSPVQNVPEPDNSPPYNPAQPVIPEEPTFNAQTVRVSIDEPRATLTQIFQIISQRSGLQIQVASGFQDHVVTARYDQIPALDILKDLGANFEFSVMIQDPTNILILPGRARYDGGALPGLGEPNMQQPPISGPVNQRGR